jgi:hypothetical protein
MRKREKVENEKSKAKIQEIADWSKTLPKPPKDEEILREILERICVKDGWYKIDDLTKELRQKPLLDKATGRLTTNLLKRLGFLQRKRGAHGYIYVYIMHDR